MADPFDAAVLTLAAVFGLWIVVEVVRYVLLKRRFDRSEDWTEEGGMRR